MRSKEDVVYKNNRLAAAALCFLSVLPLVAMFAFALIPFSKADAQSGAPTAAAQPAAPTPQQTTASVKKGGGGSEYQSSCDGATCKFVFLAPLPIEGISGEGEFDLGGDGATAYVKGLYVFGVAVAAGLAVIMIVLGGIEMSTVDAASGKIDGGGRKKINAALSGLALALVSWLILSTVNVNLLSSNFVPQRIDVDTSIGQGDGGQIAVAPGAAYPPGFVGPIQGLTAAGSRLESTALSKLGQSTCDISGTSSGKLACAYTVNDIVNDALGKPVTGNSNSPDSYGRSTTEMYQSLVSNDRFMLVGQDVSTVLPGDIIVSPTQGSNVGHVGIYASTGKIISNSSSGQQVDDNFNPASWQNYYSGKKGLQTYVFRAR